MSYFELFKNYNVNKLKNALLRHEWISEEELQKEINYYNIQNEGARAAIQDADEEAISEILDDSTVEEVDKKNYLIIMKNLKLILDKQAEADKMKEFRITTVNRDESRNLAAERAAAGRRDAHFLRGSGKKSRRRLRKRTTIKGGKRKRRRTRRRR